MTIYARVQDLVPEWSTPWDCEEHTEVLLGHGGLLTMILALLNKVQRIP